MTLPDGDLVIVGSVGVEVRASARRFARSLKREVEQAFRGAGASLAKALQDAADQRTVKVKVEPNFDQDALDEAVAARRVKPVRVPVDADKKSAAAAGVEASATATAAAKPVRLKADVDRASIRKLLGVLGRAVTAAVVSSLVVSAVGALGQGIAALLAGLTAALFALVAPLGHLVSVLVTAAGSLAVLPGAIAIGVVALATLKVGLSGVGEAMKALGKDTEEFNEAIKDLAPAAQEFLRTIRDLRPAFQELRMDVQERLFAGFGDAVRELADVHLVTLQSRMSAVATTINATLLDAVDRLTTKIAKADIRGIFSDAANTVANLSRAFGPLIDVVRDVVAVGAQVTEELTRGAGSALDGFADRIAQMRESGELRALITDGLDALKLLGSALVDIVGIFRGFFAAAGAAGGGGIFGFLERLNELVNSVSAQESLGTFFRELGRIGDALMPVLSALGSALAVVSIAIGDIAVETAPHLAEFLLLLGDALAALAPGFIALGPSVVALGKALLPLATILADLVVALAPGIEALLTGLGAGLALLAPAATVVGQALADVLEAVAPLLPLLGGALASTLTVVATVMSGLVSGPLPALLDAFVDLWALYAEQVIPVITELAVELLPIFAEVGLAVAEAFIPLLPVIAELGQVLAGKFADALPDLVDAFATLAEVAALFAEESAQALVDVLLALVPQLPALVDAGLALALALTDMLVALAPQVPLWAELLELVLELVTPSNVAALVTLLGLMAGVATLTAGAVETAAGAVETLAGWLGGVDWKAIGDGFLSAAEAVGGFFTDLFGWIADTPGHIATFLSGLPGQVAGLFQTMAAESAYWVGLGVGRILTHIRDMPGQVLDLLLAAFDAIVEVVAAGVDAVVGYFRGLPGEAAVGVSTLWQSVSGAFTELVNNATRRAAVMVSRFITELGSLPGRAHDEAVKVKDQILAAFVNVDRWLWQVGRDLIAGLVAGIASLTDVAVDAVVGVGGRLLAGIKDGLGIRSPSRVFAEEVGRWIPEGIAEGVRRNQTAPLRAVDDLLARFDGGFAWEAAAQPVAAGTAGGTLTGELFLSDGTFLGVVRGQVRTVLDEHDRDVDLLTRQGTGAAR